MKIIDLIKRHNKNIKDFIEISNNVGFNAYHGNYSKFMEYEKPKTISSIFGVVNCKKEIVSSYNILAKKYNSLVYDTNDYVDEISLYKSMIKSTQDRMEKLKSIESKLLLMCQKVNKPDDYDHCVYLRNEQVKWSRKLYDLLNYRAIASFATFEEQVVGRTYLFHNFWDVTTTKKVLHKPRNFTKKDEIVKNEKIKEAKAALEYINNEIKQHPNFEHNMKLNYLYTLHDTLEIVIEGMPRLVEQEQNKLNETNLAVNNFKECLNKLKEKLDDDKAIMNELFPNKRLNLTELNEIKKVKEPIIFSDIGTKIVSELSYAEPYKFYSLSVWEKVCNECIDLFNVEYVDKNESIKEDGDDNDYVCDDYGAELNNY